MPAKHSKKKPEPEPESEPEEEDEEEEEEDEEEEGEEGSDAEIEYDVNTMTDAHLKPVMNVLDWFLPGEACPPAVEGLAQLCLESPFTSILDTVEDTDTIGTDVHGVISLVDLRKSIANEGVKRIVEMIESLEDKKYFHNLFATKSIGFIIGERVVRLPELAAQMFVNLMDEYNASKTKGTFDYFLVLARVALDRGDEDEAEGADGRPESSKKKKRKVDTPSANARLSVDTINESSFLCVEHWYCWQYRDVDAPFLQLSHPENVMRTQEGEIAPHSKNEISIPIIVRKANLADIVEKVKTLDGYYDAE